MNFIMHVAILIKILLEITLFDFMLTHVIKTMVYFSMNLEIIRSVFKLIFSRREYLKNYIYKATSNLAELVSKI